MAPRYHFDAATAILRVCESPGFSSSLRVSFRRSFGRDLGHGSSMFDRLQPGDG
jgi:hypothetical protein